MDNMFKMGATEMKGEIWDEKGGSNLKEILITHQQDFINSIRFTYLKDDKAVHSQTYGKPNGLKFNMVNINYPHEVLTSLSGEYNKADGRLVSIVFGTNYRTYGPFGRTSSTGSSLSNTSSLYDEFKYDMLPGRFGGFHGSVDGGYVHAIGVYVRSYEVIDMDDYIDALCGDHFFS